MALHNPDKQVFAAMLDGRRAQQLAPNSRCDERTSFVVTAADMPCQAVDAAAVTDQQTAAHRRRATTYHAIAWAWPIE